MRNELIQAVCTFTGALAWIAAGVWFVAFLFLHAVPFLTDQLLSAGL